MGTHIDCIIPKEKDYSVEEIKLKLKSVFEKNKSAYLHLEKYGAFTENVNGDWWINLIPADEDNPEYITGEGDCFDIDIYENVVCISCVERFSCLYLTERNITKELFQIINELSKIFRTTDKMLIGAGGFGETDQILDMAFNESADFEQLFQKMTELNGIPANDLTALKERSWYLKK